MRKILLGTALAIAAVTYAQAQQQTGTTITPENVLELVDANGNGRITCAEAKAAGLSLPVTSDHPAYRYMRDGDGDGNVCE